MNRILVEGPRHRTKIPRRDVKRIEHLVRAKNHKKDARCGCPKLDLRRSIKNISGIRKNLRADQL